MVLLLAILAPMLLPKCALKGLIALLVLASFGCAGKKQVAKKPDLAMELERLAPAITALFESKVSLPLLYFTPDSLYLYQGLLNNGFDVYLLGTEEKIAAFTTDPRFQGDIMGAMVMTSNGLKADGVNAGNMLLDRPISSMELPYLQLVMRQGLQVLEPGGKLVLIQTKEQSRAANKQIDQLREGATFSRAYTDSTRSSQFDLLIFEK